MISPEAGHIREDLMRSIVWEQRVLGSQQALRRRAMPFALGVLLEGVGAGDRAIAQELAVHRFQG